MSEFIILITNTISIPTPKNGYFTTGSLNLGTIGGLTKKSFPTYEEALAYARTLSYGVTIYEAVAETQIKHEVTKINENRNRSARKQD